MILNKLILSSATYNWWQAITIFVSILSIFISHYLGSRKDQKLVDMENEKRKYELDKLKYNSLFVPFYKILSKWQPDFQFSQVFKCENSYEEFNNLLDENLQYLSEESHSLYLDYLYHLNNFENTRDFNVDEPTLLAFENVNTTFNKLIRQLLLEGSRKSEELNLSNLSKSFFDVLDTPDDQKHHLYTIKKSQ